MTMYIVIKKTFGKDKIKNGFDKISEYWKTDGESKGIR